MSDPVTNVEIEDVLSSIRRLVSEDSRAPTEQAGDRAETSDEAPDRLVLTPALRVQDPVQDPVPPREEPRAQDNASSAPDPFGEEPGPDEMRLTRRLRPSQEEQNTPAWRRASFEPLRAVPDASEVPAEASTSAHAPRPADVLSGPSPDPAPAPEDARPEEPDSAAGPAAADEPEAEEAPFIEVAEEDAAEEEGASIADFFAAKLRDTPRGPAAEPPLEPVAEIAPKEGSLARKIAELEEMIARSTSDFEPETGEAAPEAIFRHQPPAAPKAPELGPEPAAEAVDEPAAESMSETLPEPQDADPEDAELARRPMPEPELVEGPYETDATGEPEVDDGEDAPFAFHRSPHASREPEAETAEPDVTEADVPDVPKPSARRPVKILRNPVWQRSQSNLRREVEELVAPATAETGTAPVPEAPETAAAGPDEAAAAAAMAGLDQETLRKLVADVVREELQGAVSDQVSRNLRKLVRLEIQRIAMSADTD